MRNLMWDSPHSADGAMAVILFEMSSWEWDEDDRPTIPSEVIRVISYQPWTGAIEAWAVDPDGRVGRISFKPARQSGCGYHPPEWEGPVLEWRSA